MSISTGTLVHALACRVTNPPGTGICLSRSHSENGRLIQFITSVQSTELGSVRPFVSCSLPHGPQVAGTMHGQSSLELGKIP